MEQPFANLTGSKDYPIYEALDEALRLVIENVEAARRSNGAALGLRMQMASRALRSAMVIYADHLMQGDKSENV